MSVPEYPAELVQVPLALSHDVAENVMTMVNDAAQVPLGAGLVAVAVNGFVPETLSDHNPPHPTTATDPVNCWLI
ncbi:hypothetical protein ASC93_00490 [Massilia sp. Root335]|nr:hypothetical protein ASC93_00490 [Massilia sp. Root335]